MNDKGLFEIEIDMDGGYHYVLAEDVVTAVKFLKKKIGDYPVKRVTKLAFEVHIQASLIQGKKAYDLSEGAE